MYLKNLEKRLKINVYYFNFLGPDGRLGPSSAQASEENAQIFVMNNYFGIGKKKLIEALKIYNRFIMLGTILTDRELPRSDNYYHISFLFSTFSLGLDADLCYSFHTEREQKPHKFTSRLHNKGVYFKVGIQKMVGRGLNKDLSKEMSLEVDGRPVDLPSIKGIIILNIMR